jgi:hypothetical protein
MNGIEFGFIPNLEKITAGEYIELDELFKQKDSYAQQMSVMYRPIKEKYKDLYRIEPFEDKDKYSDIMEFAPVSAYFGAKVFFCNLLSELLKTIQTCLVLQTEETRILEEVLVNNGVGINQFIQLLEETLLNLKEQQHSTFIHSLHF